MKALMIYPKYPEETFWNGTRSMLRFSKKHALTAPLGLLTLASYLPADFEVRLVDRNFLEETDADWNWADVVFLSLMMAQREDYEVCVSKAKVFNKPIAVGGPFTHAMPEIAVRDADWVCFGEAEDIIESLVSDIRAGVRGKQYQGGNNTDMTTVRMPRFEILPHLNECSLMPIQFSRGCPFRCEFCDVIEIYGRVPRTKQPAQVLDELSLLKRHGFRGMVFVVDDNFIGNKKSAKILLKEMGKWSQENGYPFRFITEVSLNIADDDGLLDAMFHANFAQVFIGIETPDPKLLKGALKLQNLPGNPLEKLARVRQHGIHVMAGFIIGFDGEKRGVFDVQRDFIEASGIGTAMLGLLQAVPQTQLFNRLKREGRLLDEVPISGLNTAEGINFIPNGELTRREYLDGYSALVEEMFQPEAFFRRITPALLTLRYPTVHFGLFCSWKQLPILLRMLYHIGVRSKGARVHFWRVLLEVLIRNPLALEAFGLDCFYFYYLNQHTAYVRREMLRYLAAPSVHDELDRITRVEQIVSA